jgi:hypothetical protein
MVIALICAIPITAIVAGFLVLKSVQLGLKWQIQTAEKKEPELKSPISPIVEAIQENKAEEKAKYSIEQMREWSPFQ